MIDMDQVGVWLILTWLMSGIFRLHVWITDVEGMRA